MSTIANVSAFTGIIVGTAAAAVAAFGAWEASAIEFTQLASLLLLFSIIIIIVLMIKCYYT